MPREAYRDRQTYEREEADRYPSRRDARRDDRGEESSSRAIRDGRERNGRISKWDDDYSSSSASRIKRRSRSPDFEKDRKREREAYDRGRQDDKGIRTSQARDSQEKGINDPVFESSGLLAKESNNKNGIALKYAEPPEARKPKKKWRLYVFKDGKEIGE